MIEKKKIKVHTGNIPKSIFDNPETMFSHSTTAETCSSLSQRCNAETKNRGKTMKSIYESNRLEMRPADLLQN